MPLELPFEFDAGRSALVVVDMQNDFVRETAPLEVPDARKTIVPINNLIGAWRALGRPVIFTHFQAGETPSLLWTWSRQIHAPTNCCKVGFRRTYPDIEGERDCIAVIDELDCRPEDPRIDKYWYGSFFRTPLKDILLSYGADSIVVTGTVTQICVEDTVRQAFHEGFKVIVAEDGVSSFAPDLHAATLKNIAMKFGAVAPSSEIVAAVQGHS
ncbi:MAG: isochorismatase family cysteine hydrolase [Bauldia litoralis]